MKGSLNSNVNNNGIIDEDYFDLALVIITNIGT
jgi:hypothetical protein